MRLPRIVRLRYYFFVLFLSNALTRCVKAVIKNAISVSVTCYVQHEVVASSPGLTCTSLQLDYHIVNAIKAKTMHGYLTDPVKPGLVYKHNRHSVSD